jgi:GrpB-like predicted nucleotidyltransferase (UPF0157 family)
MKLYARRAARALLPCSQPQILVRGRGRRTSLYFVKRASDGRRIVQLHVTQHQGVFWRRIVAFRNALRSDSKAAAEYEQLKARLSKKYHNDRSGYRDGKSNFVSRVVDGVERWP